MAITLERIKVTSNLSSIIDGAITTVRAMRSANQAKQESDFQLAVADGMSYSAQLQFRQKQLDDESASSFSDPQYKAQLTADVTTLKKLGRFSVYRAKYQSSLAELSLGKITAEQHLSMLKDQLSQTTDPELIQEINGEITSASAEVKKYNDTVLANEVKRAQNDGSTTILNDAISKVQDKKSIASLNGNEEMVSAYDNTITVLKAQLGEVKIQDELNSAQIKSITKGLGVMDKIDVLNTQIANADSNVSVVIQGKRYASAQDYWTQLRNGYIAGNGIGIWKDMFMELGTYYTKTIDAAVSRDGYATAMTMDSIKSNFDTMKNRPEMQPYLDRINTLESSTLANAFDTTAKTIVNTASFTGDYKEANDQLLEFSKRYGVNSDGYRLSMATQMATQLQTQVNAGNISTEAALKLNKDTGLAPETFTTPSVAPVVPAPQSTTPTATSTTTPAITPAPITPPPTITTPETGTHTVVAGDTLNAIASKNNVTLAQLLDANPQFKANPNAINIGQSVTLPTTPTTSTVETSKPQTPTVTQTPTSTPVTQTSTPATSTPPITPTIIPTSTQTSTPQQHVVTAGDTLGAIATTYKTDVPTLMKLNPTIVDANKIQTGAKLNLPTQ